MPYRADDCQPTAAARAGESNDSAVSRSQPARFLSSEHHELRGESSFGGVDHLPHAGDLHELVNVLLVVKAEVAVAILDIVDVAF